MLNGNADTPHFRLAGRRPIWAEHSAPTGFSHILVPTNLVRQEHTAITTGFRLAEIHRSQLTVLRVLPPIAQPNSVHWLDAIERLHRDMTSPDRSSPDPDACELIDRERAAVVSFLERELPGHWDARRDVRAECRRGDRAYEIARFAEHANVDLIVLCAEPRRWRIPILPAYVRQVMQLTRTQILLVRSARNETSLSANGASVRSGL